MAPKTKEKKSSMANLEKKSEEKCSMANRDSLLEMESKVRKWWEEEDRFKAESKNSVKEERKKFFATFPIPYMNGYLHLGHAFSVSKVDFAAVYHRLRGFDVLLPFGFNCTGLPISSSADKLSCEMRDFGNPPVFPAEEKSESSDDLGQYSNVASKSGGQIRQWEIMRRLGYNDSQIAKFAEPSEWFYHFIPSAVEDLNSFGLGCDWRRSFVTTDHNPFFDAFVKWQMRKLKSMGMVVKKEKYTIFSPLHDKPCADDDRATSEGVQIVEYTLIKMQVLDYPPNLCSTSKLDPLEGKEVFLAAATSRPETLYGQTNVWVSPDEKYGAYEINETDVFIVTGRAALNLAYQNLSKVPQKPSCLVEFTGRELIGLALRSPLSKQEVIYALPMFTIPKTKAIGANISVPSFVPDDYMALRDLRTKSKPNLRTKFGVEDKWVMPIKILPVIKVPTLWDWAVAAEVVCTELEIRSQRDMVKLEDAKKGILKEAFNKGTMLTGEFADRRVQEIRPILKDQLLDSGEAVLYCEPENQVMSRWGDECVVALTDQWCITYGEERWKNKAKECLSEMNVYPKETRTRAEKILSSLNQWSCSSTSGLGTRIPWDEEFLVESFTDSALYMAYYTIAHFFHDGDMYKGSKCSIRPEQMSDEIWEYIFCDGAYPISTTIEKKHLSQMKQEFDYWYPLDLRVVSGKELIQNHLPFFIHNHTALMAKHNWPRGVRCDGPIMLKSEKKVSSTGNSRTLCQTIKEFSATAVRFTLADAGDGVGDASFAFETANGAILRLTNELEWMELAMDDIKHPMRTGPPSTFADKVFENDINIAIRLTENNYNECSFKEALKNGFYDLQTARNEYRLSCGGSKVTDVSKLNRDLIMKFMDVQARLIEPICPQFAEHVWRDVLKKTGSVLTAGWPESNNPDWGLKSRATYLKDFISSMRRSIRDQVLGFGVKKVLDPTDNKMKDVRVKELNLIGLVYVRERYEGWHAHTLETLGSKFSSETRRFAPDKEILADLKERLSKDGIKFQDIEKRCMPFIKLKKKEAITQGSVALSLSLPFKELEFLSDHMELIKDQLELERVVICSAIDADDVKRASPYESLLDRYPPLPGSPTIIVFSI